MATSPLIFAVKAETSSAVSGFRKLAASLKPVEKEADAASKSLSKMGKTKVAPKVDDKQIHKVTEEIKRLQDEMAHRLSMDVHANTTDVRRKITGLRATLKELQRVPPITPRANVGPITRGIAALKGKFAGIGQAIAGSKLGGFAQRLGSDLSSVGGIIGGIAGKIGQFGSALGGVLSSVGPGIGAALAGVAALGVGIAATTVKALGLADAFERNKLQMNVFTHNVQATNKLLAQVQKYADSTPFEFPELASASKMLLGIGIAADKVVPQLKKIGDIAALSGADVSQLTTIFQQMTSSGRLSAGDMNQLVNAGVNAWPVLAKSMGKTVGQVRKLSEEGKIGSKDIQKFWDTLAKGASGATTALAGTLSGMVSTLKDTMTGVLRDIGTAILPFAKIIVPQLTKATEGLGGKIATMLPGWIDSLAEGAKSLLDFGGQVLTGLKNVTVGFINGIAGFQSSMGNLLTSLGGFMGDMAGILRALAILNPAFSGIADDLETSSGGLVKSGEDMKKAADGTAKSAEAAGKNWDKWIASYNAGATKAKNAISAAQLKSALVISTGNAQSEVDKLKAKLDKIDGTKAHPIVNADTKAAAAKLKTAEGWLKQLDKYVADPKLLAKDLASGKVKYVKGQLQSVPKSHNTDVNAKNKTGGPVKSAKGAIGSVPQTHDTTLNAHDHASGTANYVESQIKSIPTSWSTTFSLNYHTNYSTSGNPSGFSPSKVPSSIQAPLGRSAAPQVSVYVRDEKLADLVDIRLDGRMLRAARTVRRRGLVTL